MENLIDEEIDYEANSINVINNNLLLTGKEMSILDQYNINYKKCLNINELLFMIDTYINEESYESDVDYADLDWIESEIAERNYYINTNK